MDKPSVRCAAFSARRHECNVGLQRLGQEWFRLQKDCHVQVLVTWWHFWSEIITEDGFSCNFFFHGENNKVCLILLPTSSLCMETLDNNPVTPWGVVVIREITWTTHTLQKSLWPAQAFTVAKTGTAWSLPSAPLFLLCTEQGSRLTEKSRSFSSF